MNGDVELLKLDVEGAENAVMRELARSGKLQNVRQIHLEYHHHIDADVDALSTMLTLLEDPGFGYQVSARSRRHGEPRIFQDIPIYGYRK